MVMRNLFHFSHITTGFVAILVGYTSSAVIIFQAASAAGASPAEISSWLWALGIGMAVTSIGLSLYYRDPVLTAWSTPGAALLISSLSGVPLSEAIGAFMVCSALITLTGVMGWFDQLMQHVPKPLAGAMLAGVLLQFGLGLFKEMDGFPTLILAMVASFWLIRRYSARYAIPITLLIGLSVAYFQGLLAFSAVSIALAKPIFTFPTFSITATVGIAFPLFIVTMASQNVPGLAVLRANGYQTPVSPIIGWTGLTGVLLAPFGGFAFNLAAITAAICMGKESDPDPKKRYLSSIWAGVFYLMTGLFGATVASLFMAFPSALIVGIAGLALLSTIGGSLSSALEDVASRDAALVTFLVTASGVSLWGLGSAFWGLLLGMAAYYTQKKT
jgi:benzoate membrane transport protein